MGNKLRLTATIFGVGFLAAGIASYLPMFVHGGNLLGLFAVDNMHSIVYIITGVIGLWTVYRSAANIGLYVKVVGIVYAILAIAGLLHVGPAFINSVNAADHLMFLVVGLIGLYMGFGQRNKG
jgi:hypothetical protein